MMVKIVNAMLVLIFAPVIFAVAAVGFGMVFPNTEVPALPGAPSDETFIPLSGLIAEIDALTEEMRKRNAELAEHNARLEYLIAKIPPTHK